MPYIEGMGTRGDRLREARKRANFATVREAAAALGVSYSTYASHENGHRQYEFDDATVYARKFRVDVNWLLTGKAGVVVAAGPKSLATIPVIGIVRAGLWQDADAGDNGLYEQVPAAPDEQVEWQFAYKVEGTSLNKRAQPGDHLICLDIVKSHYDVKENDLVIVQRSRFDGQMIERTAKRVRRTITGYELWPESTDPLYQEPIRLDNTDDGSEYAIIGKVLFILSRP